MISALAAVLLIVSLTALTLFNVGLCLCLAALVALVCFPETTRKAVRTLAAMGLDFGRFINRILPALALFVVILGVLFTVAHHFQAMA